MNPDFKTGLLTFYHIHHYGAPLQAAATKWAVESLGASCDIIHYYVNQNNALFRLPTGLGSALSDIHTAAHYAALKRRYDRFNAFEHDVLGVGARPYGSFDELRRANLPYDVLISGSDQIWNPLIFPDRHFDPVFFGAFSDARKIAYAPSFGLPRLPDGMGDELRAYLSAYSHLSTREQSGRDILRAVTDAEAPVVLDPVLLRTEHQWSAVAAPPEPFPNGPYLLCYFIHPPVLLAPYIRLLSESLRFPVVQLCGTRRKASPDAHCIFDAGPTEFVRLFRDAAFVLTNSFHGTAFSVLFQRPFFTAVAPGEQAEPEKSRSYHLLRRLGLTDRIVGIGQTAALDALIDWQNVRERLQKERETSLSYLQRALYQSDRPGMSGGAVYIPASGARALRNTEKPLPKLASHERCTGCTACASVCPKRAITMERDEEGFLFPKINPERCVRCGRCTAVCPIPHPMEPRPAPAVFAAWHRDPVTRRDSSSGGAFSALAEYVLENGGVVFGAAMDGKQRVRHTICMNKEELWRLRGAKYVQSDLGKTFALVREALKSRSVLFSGTPCQVDGLYRFLGARPENLITCDIVCHGVPSPGVWEDMVRSLRREQGLELRAVRFRNKVAGWKLPHFTAVYENGLVDSRPFYETEYGRAFGRALFLRRSCHHCPYASLNRPGDFTLGDFWGLDDYPEEEGLGISLLMVNTPHGAYVFDNLPLVRKPATLEQALKGNPRLSSPTPPQAQRSAFFTAYALEPFDKVRKRFLALPPLPLRILRKAAPPLVNVFRRLLRRPPR
ncbi:MAG: Coenzyme F420 hydrogenase/dehydrogenase, beta subunit C-terminal domain [Oscillibacter sp.]|nr:Coenzyme F420 hydrogenase/dehydrogenase, beta subunit C-terminal domain [Oscillibacter sp.]